MMRGSKADEIMTLLFMLLAVGAVVFFVLNNRLMFLYLGGGAVLLRLVQYVLRFVKK